MSPSKTNAERPSAECIGWRPAGDGSMTASRLKPRARSGSVKNPWSSGPRWAMRTVARPTHSVSGPAPSASARQPVIPPMRAAQRSGSSRFRAPASLLGLEPDPAVEADDLGVHVVVLDKHPDQVAELIRPPHPLGEYYRADQLGLELLGVLREPVDGGVDDAGADRVHPHPDDAEVPCGRQGHPDDAALGRGVRDLAGLALDARYRGGVDDDAALPVGVRRFRPGHGGRRDAHQVEGTDQVDGDDLLIAGP